MKDSSTENLIKRINQLEEKIYRYTEIQADIYAHIIRFDKTLEDINHCVKSIEKEIQTIERKLKKG